MTERVVVVARRPPEAMWDVLCDRVCELPRFLEAIVAAEALPGDAADGGVVRRSHRWQARANVPAILAPHIDADYLHWTCRTEWDRDRYRSRWVIEPGFLASPQSCEATLEFLPALGGAGTRIQLELDVTRVRMPEAMRVVTVRILATHFRLLVEAAAKLLEQEASAASGPAA